MPIKVKSKKLPAPREGSPVSIRHQDEYERDLPDIATHDSFRDVVKKLSLYFVDVIELPSTFEQLRTTAAGTPLRILVDHLSATCTNPAIVNALLALKWHYASSSEHRTLGESRADACEIVAWRFLTRLSEREAVNFCLYEIPDFDDEDNAEAAGNSHTGDAELGESSPLLSHLRSIDNRRRGPGPAGSSMKRNQLLSSLSRLTMTSDDGNDENEGDPTSSFKNLNALEIAAIADAKRFLSQHIVQKIITAIWSGDIIFWDSLSVHSTKKVRFYNPRTADPFSRLRVPKYLKSWEVLFFCIFLALYYAVLIVRDESRITIPEVILFFWIAAFFYDELSEWLDAGSIFYATDIWNLFDMIMIAIGFTFAILRIIGIIQNKSELSDLAFDILALEALFMIPRIFSILSLSPAWGTLIPCLKEMGKDFFKYMVLVVVVYCGFLTTFSLVGRDVFAFKSMAWILTKIFYGSAPIGFEVMNQIDPFFGPPLMIVFITLSSFLLMGSLTGMLSNSFSRVITHAKEEYLYVYSVYVLEASTSNRLTHFFPPFNLLAFVIFRPWRLFFSADEKFRAGRIVLLKATHWPIVGIIKLYEMYRKPGAVYDEFAGFKGPSHYSRRNGRHAIAQKQSTSNAARQAFSPTPRGRENGQSTEDDMDTPTAMEVQLTELNRKIDQLTATILAMQEKQASGNDSGSSSVSATAA
ncbi:Calcium channel YVC1 [Fusarium austroafricanum]|uniref:Calcium channel YVC1 n=1 Tax=Fusarium austroafricanum TaxID=2364996 RepID=A0A8H4K7Z8_9HYPO|nr:Calcium channel YVC1 [Fusarium austroafricanum]